MKIARVIPLFKNGNANDFTNYRPISLLSQFSKIFEKIFHNRMMSFIEEKNILYESQYGFRKNMSTSLAILLKISPLLLMIVNTLLEYSLT